MLKNLLNICAFCFVISLVCLMGCSNDEPEFIESEDRAQLENMRQEILDFAGEPQCGNSGNCRYIGVGSKACGGPWFYLVYSTSSVDSLALANLVSAYNQYNDVLNQRYGWVSDCSVPNTPNLDCQEGLCVDLGYQPK